MQKYFLFIILVGILDICKAQNSKFEYIDSILNTKNLDKASISVIIDSVKAHLFDNQSKVLEIADQIIQISEEKEIAYGLANGFNLKGIIYYYQGNYTSSLANYLNSLKAYQIMKDTSGIALINYNLGSLYFVIKDFKYAIKYYKDALASYQYLFESENNKKKFFITKIINILNDIGSVYNELDESTQAMEHFNKAIQMSEHYNLPELKTAPIHNKGLIFLKSKQYNQALNNFNKGLILEKLYGNNDGIIESYWKIAETYIELQKNEQAKIYLDTALQISKNLNVKGKLCETYSLYSLLYEKIRNYDKALEFYKLHISLKDSLFDLEKSIQFAEMQTKHETEKTEKENQLLKEKDLRNEQLIKNQRNITIFISTGLILILIIAGILYVNNIRRKKTNRLLVEKNIHINKQNEEIKIQRDAIAEQRDIINRRHKQMEDSIIYAKRIQNALLSFEPDFTTNFLNLFIFFKPKNIVSGDFFFIKNIKNHIIIAAADCTGHGVPGAFMSMLGITLLNEITQKHKIQSSAHILNQLRLQIKKSLGQTGASGEQQDGMDIAFCLINTEDFSLNFAGAFNPCWIFRKTDSATTETIISTENKISKENKIEFFELEADSQPISIFIKEVPFSEKNFQLQKNDVFYIFSDGFHSQFGGPKNEKYKSNNFNQFLRNICELELEKQKENLENEFNSWKGDNYQIDDLLIIGVKISNN